MSVRIFTTRIDVKKLREEPFIPVTPILTGLDQISLVKDQLQVKSYGIVTDFSKGVPKDIKEVDVTVYTRDMMGINHLIYIHDGKHVYSVSACTLDKNDRWKSKQCESSKSLVGSDLFSDDLTKEFTGLSNVIYANLNMN